MEEFPVAKDQSDEGPEYEDMTVRCGVEGCLQMALYACQSNHVHRGDVAEEWKETFDEDKYVDHPRYVCVGHKQLLEERDVRD